MVKRVRIAVFGQDPDVAFAVRHLIFAGGVVSHIRIADVLDVPHDAVEDFGDFNVPFIVGWNNFATWPVLALVIGHLPNVLGQLVDRQARACVDRLSLHRPTGCKHICWPLPMVIR